MPCSTTPGDRSRLSPPRPDALPWAVRWRSAARGQVDPVQRRGQPPAVRGDGARHRARAHWPPCARTSLVGTGARHHTVIRPGVAGVTVDAEPIAGSRPRRRRGLGSPAAPRPLPARPPQPSPRRPPRQRRREPGAAREQAAAVPDKSGQRRAGTVTSAPAVSGACPYYPERARGVSAALCREAIRSRAASAGSSSSKASSSSACASSRRGIHRALIACSRCRAGQRD